MALSRRCRSRKPLWPTTPGPKPCVWRIFAQSLRLCGNTLTELILHLDQQSVCPGVYNTYERTYTDSRDAFLAYETHRLGWKWIMVRPFWAPRHRNHALHLSRIAMGTQEAPWPHGDILLWKVYLTDPADFGNSGKSLTQDYAKSICIFL